MSENQSKEYWQILCERAARESDPEQLMKLIRELNQVLAQHNRGEGSGQAA